MYCRCTCSSGVFVVMLDQILWFNTSYFSFDCKCQFLILCLELCGLKSSKMTWDWTDWLADPWRQMHTSENVDISAAECLKTVHTDNLHIWLYKVIHLLWAKIDVYIDFGDDLTTTSSTQNMIVSIGNIEEDVKTWVINWYLCNSFQ